ncbi:CPBP family intramembrane glutamic endopeptidase [Bacillus alkalicellulosilyticus]|uniref:CPBP family intramembrane glutamic endopeptidase n=1 Tax=Alkalihalobacterium alkalicellulosilyticum TaxID=1912214 RepID=UPI000998940D|nr:type II CAAX endopeptidase family protein [Bacillus alkalicellulosilyticus]
MSEPVKVEGVDAPKEKPEVSFGWKHLILFILAYLGINIIFGLLFGIVDVISGGNLMLDTILSGYNALLYDGVVFVLAILLFKSVRTFLRPLFSLAPFKKGITYLYLLASVVLLFSSQYLIIGVLGWENPSATNDLILGDFSIEWVSILLLFSATALLTPVKEEILYRGIIHHFLEKRYHFLVGLIVSSLIFGLLHLGYPLTATLMGMVFVILFKLTRSLMVPIVLHIVWNAYAVIVLLQTF